MASNGGEYEATQHSSFGKALADLLFARDVCRLRWSAGRDRFVEPQIQGNPVALIIKSLANEFFINMVRVQKHIT